MQVFIKNMFNHRNISKLDAAKRNLTESLNALARLQMYLSLYLLKLGLLLLWMLLKKSKEHINISKHHVV